MAKLDLDRIDKDWLDNPKYAGERMVYDNAGMVICLCGAMLIKNPVLKTILGSVGMVLAIRFNHNMAEALNDIQKKVD